MKLLAKLRVRLVLWTVALETVILVVFAVLLVFILDRSQNQQIEETLRLGASQLNAVVDQRDGQYVVDPVDTAALQEQGIMAWIVTPDGVVAKTIGRASDMPVPVDLPGLQQFSNATLTDGTPIRFLVAPLQEGADRFGTLILGLSLRPSQTLLRQIVLSLVVAIPLIAVLSGIGGLFLANRALKPVSDVTKMARQFSTADLSQRLNLTLPDDEIGQLARTFDAMLERLDRAFQRERQLTSDISHELRTPLGMLKTQLSLARSRPRDVDTLLKMMAEMEGDVDRMTRLIEQILMLARMENLDPLQSSILNLGDTVTAVVEEFAPLADARSIHLAMQIPQEAAFDIQGNPQLMHRVLANLLENALQYTEAGGSVTVGLYKNTQDIVLTVQDTGQGIPPEHLPHLFERFYRVDNARSRESGGVGLGLAITRAIVEAHGGRIEATSRIGPGTTFSVTLPNAGSP